MVKLSSKIGIASRRERDMTPNYGVGIYFFRLLVLLGIMLLPAL